MNLTTPIRRELATAVAELDAKVQVTPGPIEYDDRGLDRMRFDVTLIVGEPQDTTAQEYLDELLDPEGVKRMLEADRRLGGLVSDLSVTACTGYLVHGPPERPRLGATWTVQTIT